MTTLEKIYPNHKIVGLYQIKVNGCKWYDTLITEEKDIIEIAKRGHDAYGRNISMMALKLQDPSGFYRIADFRPNEIF